MAFSLPSVTLHKGKERPLWRRHPWIFAGAIAATDADLPPGALVWVKDHRGRVLGTGAFSPTSQIRVRMFTFDDTTVVDDAWFCARVDAAVAHRRRHVLRAGPQGTDACRLVFAENDGLPGVVVDVYGSTVVFQCQSAGAERFRDALVAQLHKTLAPTRIVERSDADIRTLEGLLPRAGVVMGAPLAESADGTAAEHVPMRENGLQFHVDVLHGHKTGFYLDQRDSRALVRAHATDARVLNCFSYTGGFAVAALAGGAAHVTSVDTSLAALTLGEKNARTNGADDARHEWLKGDCFDVLQGMDGDGERFDLIVLDPPKFAPSKKHLDRAVRGYQQLALRALHLLNPGGMLFTFSCSGAVDRALFSELTAEAARDARRDVRVLAHLGHALCHPVALAFPEGEYLKGLFCVVA